MCLQGVEVEDAGRHLLVSAVRLLVGWKPVDGEAWDLEISAEVPGCLEVVYEGAVGVGA